ncbi:hypothetical protein BJX64DRAFT_294845 [Aspergillus heterothallicus]
MPDPSAAHQSTPREEIATRVKIRRVSTWRDAGEAEYYNVDFKNTKGSNPDDSGVIFIAKEKLDTFKSLAHDKDNQGLLAVTVTSDFLYGQNKDGRKRFLVYHDRARVIFQHRFTDGAVKKVLELAQQMAQKTGHDEITAVRNLLGGTLGDKLREFK